MRCEDVIGRELQFVRPEDHVHLAARKMRDANVGLIPVCDDDHVLVGVITDRDLALRVLANEWPANTRVAEVMTQDGLVTCRPDDDLASAMRLMRESQVSRVVVTDADDHALGVVSYADVVHRAAGSDTAELMRDVTEREIASPP